MNNWNNHIHWHIFNRRGCYAFFWKKKIKQKKTAHGELINIRGNTINRDPHPFCLLSQLSIYCMHYSENTNSVQWLSCKYFDNIIVGHTINKFSDLGSELNDHKNVVQVPYIISAHETSISLHWATCSTFHSSAYYTCTTFFILSTCSYWDVPIKATACTEFLSL